MSTKQYIIRKRKEIDQFRRSDRQYLELNTEHTELKDRLKDTFAQIQSLATDFPDETERRSQLGVLDETMTQLSELIKMNEQEIDVYVGTKFSDFKARYPGMLKLFLSGDYDQDAFIHALDTVTLLEQGKINLEQGKEMGFHRNRTQ
jgi:hypothetical protein